MRNRTDILESARQIQEQSAQLAPFIEIELRKAGGRAAPGKSTLAQIEWEMWMVAMRVAASEGTFSKARIEAMYTLSELFTKYQWSKPGSTSSNVGLEFRVAVEYQGSKYHITKPFVSPIGLILTKGDAKPSDLARDYAVLLFSVGTLVARSDGKISYEELAELNRMVPGLPKLDRSPMLLADIREAVDLVQRTTAAVTPVIVDAYSRAGQFHTPEVTRDSVLQEFLTMSIRVALADPGSATLQLEGIQALFRALEFEEARELLSQQAGAQERQLRTLAENGASPFNPASPMQSSVRTLLHEVDRRCGTDHEGRFWDAMFRVANIIARLNGAVSPAETAELQRFGPSAPQCHQTPNRDSLELERRSAAGTGEGRVRVGDIS